MVEQSHKQKNSGSGVTVNYNIPNQYFHFFEALKI